VLPQAGDGTETVAVRLKTPIENAGAKYFIRLKAGFAPERVSKKSMPAILFLFRLIFLQQRKIKRKRKRKRQAKPHFLDALSEDGPEVGLNRRGAEILERNAEGFLASLALCPSASSAPLR